MHPLLAQFSHEQIGPLNGYRETFQCPVEFEQAFSGVRLDNALLDAPLPQADAQLARLHRQYAQARLAARARAVPSRHTRRDSADELLIGSRSRCEPSR